MPDALVRHTLKTKNVDNWWLKLSKLMTDHTDCLEESFQVCGETTTAAG